MPDARRALAIVGIGVLFGATASFTTSGGSAAEVDTSSVTTVVAPETTHSQPTVTTALDTTTTAVPPVTAPSRGSLVVHGTGDTSFDPDYIWRFRQDGYGVAFEGLDGLFVEDDITIVNLECTPSDVGVPEDKEFVFRCDPDALAVMTAGGVDVASLANNHSRDHGAEALLDGVARVREAGMDPVGVGVDLSAATAPAVIEVNGWRVAVLGMGGVVPHAGWLATDTDPGMASGDDIEQMTAAIAAAADTADLVFVTIHWGVELESEPEPDDVERARAMIAAGADAIFGHHSHRLGRLEYVSGAPVFWSLGNFVWPRLSDASATTGVARLEIDPEGRVVACLLPALIETSGSPVLTGARDCGQAP